MKMPAGQKNRYTLCHSLVVSESPPSAGGINTGLWITFVTLHIFLTLCPPIMGRTAKSGRRPLSSSEITLLKTLGDECSLVRATLNDKSGRKFSSLKHWVQSRGIPHFNSKFPPADSEEADVCIFSVCSFYSEFLLENLPMVQEPLQAVYLDISGYFNANTSRPGFSGTST